MIMKEHLVNRLMQVLEEGGYANFLYEGCFDILARNDRFLAIKALTNVDAMSKENATNLKIFSHFFSANALMVSMRSNHGELQKNVIYSRFNIPTMTPELFEELIVNEWLPSIFSIKGKHTVTIDVDLLRSERQKRGMSLDSLSDEIGISKKSLYEIENERVRPTLGVVERLQDSFQVNLVKPYELEPVGPQESIKPQTSMQKKISSKFDEFEIEHSFLTASPFEIIGKKRKPMLTSLTEDDFHLEMRTQKLSHLLAFTGTLGFFILKKMEKENIHGIPVLLNSEMDELENYRDFYRLIKERS